MGTSVVQIRTPEEQEYARYLVTIEERKRRVSDLRMELESLKLSIGQFDVEYHARVGVLFTELDRLRLAIDEYERRIVHLQTDPCRDLNEIEREIDAQFARQRENVRSEDEETRRYEQAHQQDQAKPHLDPDAEERAKRLFRELAKRFHPDLARTEDERRRRAEIMQRVNAAFHERDITAMEAMITVAEVTDPTFEARSIGEKLVWAIREVARLNDLEGALQTKINSAKQTNTYALWQRQENGELVIERLEKELERDVTQAGDTLAALIDNYRQLVERSI